MTIFSPYTSSLYELDFFQMRINSKLYKLIDLGTEKRQTFIASL